MRRLDSSRSVEMVRGAKDARRVGMKWEKLFWITEGGGGATEEKSKFIKDEEKQGRNQGGVGVEGGKQTNKDR